MIYQGTVLGPILWDVFFEDVYIPVRKSGFKEISFADDLNSYRRYNGGVDNKLMKKHAHKCQAEVHMWGKAKQITFEPTKESISIISNTDAEGPDFKLMGLWFDTALSMKRAVSDLCNSVR